MKAAVVHEAGGPENFKIEQRPIPTPKNDEVLIRVRAFGINRSEMFTRKGLSPLSQVKFPRILGIEATGTVVSAPGNERTFPVDAIVATAMGGMGRNFDGGYAEYTCVPADQVQVLKTADKVPWSLIGALPEMMQTVYGALFTSLHLLPTDHLLIRGGTTSVGLTASALAKHHGAHVTSTTRDPAKTDLLKQYGADEVLIDTNGSLSPAPGKFTKVLEMIGVLTVVDSLQHVETNGTLCMVGTVGDKFAFEEGFNPMLAIPTAVSLTTYLSSKAGVLATPLDEIIKLVIDGKLKIAVGKVFNGLEQIVEAHRIMDSNGADGKIVVVVE